MNIRFFVLALSLCMMSSCFLKKKGDDTEWGGFEKLDYEGQLNAPNMVLIPGGTFTMGQTGQDVVYDWNNIPRRVSVTSFYMDETEVSNINWREYVYWLETRYESHPQVAFEALPDEKVWYDELSYNDPLVETYFKHPAYDDYPVVGVTWEQTQGYCKWRTDRVNEFILIERGILNPTPDQKDADVFDTDAYLEGQYEGNVRKNLPDIRTGGERSVKFEDGILTPSFRLPTEAEWEYAALALLGNHQNPKDELISDRRYYPWDGASPRYQTRDKKQGRLLANFKRAKGDYAGIAGQCASSYLMTSVSIIWQAMLLSGYRMYIDP